MADDINPTGIGASNIAPPPTTVTPPTLSDGTPVSFPPNMTTQQQQAMLPQLEDMNDQRKASQSPNGVFVNTQRGTISSDRSTRPATAGGAAWINLENSAPVKWIRENIVQPATKAADVQLEPDQYLADAQHPTSWLGQNIKSGMEQGAESFARGKLGNVTSIPDMAAEAYNLHVAKPLGLSEVQPNVQQNVNDFFGLQQPSSQTQAIVDMVLGGRPTRAGVLRTGAAGVGSTVGSDVGGQIGQAIGGDTGRDYGQFYGSFLGGSGAASRTAAKGVATAFAHPDAPDIYSAAERANINPSFRSLATPTGQRLSTVVGAIPFAGSPVEHAFGQTASDIQRVRDEAANAVSQNRIPPSGITTRGDIGGAMIDAAQQAEPGMRAAVQGIYDPINQAMEGRRVNIGPVLDQAQQAVANTSPAIARAVTAPLEDLRSRALGQPGQPIGPTRPGEVSVPYTSLKDVVTGYKQQLGRGETSVPQNYVGDVKGIAQDAMRQATIEAGVPPTGPGSFDEARADYARMRPQLSDVRDLSGTPVTAGPTPVFTGTPGEEAAYRTLAGNLQSPSTLGELAGNINQFGNNAFGVPAGQLLSTLGSRKAGEPFRPEHFAEEWSKLPEQTKATLAPGYVQQLNDAATVGANAVTPMARHGMISSIVAGDIVREGMRKAAEAGKWLMPGAMGGAGFGGHLEHPGVLGAAVGTALPMLTAYGVARGIESPMVKQAMGGRSLGYGAAALRNLPITSRVISNQMYNNP